MNQRKMLRIGTAWAVTLCAVSLRAQAPAKADRPGKPVQAVLLAPLDLTHTHPGSVVLARVDAAWQDPSCVLNAGNLVKGRVTAVTKRSKLEKNSNVQIAFDGADCRNHPASSPHFAIIAIVGPLANDNRTAQTGVSEGPPLSNDLPLQLGGGFRSINTASAITDTFVLPARNLPSTIMPGQVIDVNRTNLDPATGPGGASIITATGKDVRLEAGTTFLLVKVDLATSNQPIAANRTAAPKAGIGGGVDTTTRTITKEVAVATAPPEPPDVTDICSGTCSIEKRGSETMAVPDHADASLDLRKFGYMPSSSSRELAHFDRDSNVVYLGKDRILCTFDPRHLRARVDVEGDTSRTIRAVIVDAKTLKVERVVDWRVRGEGSYLWQLTSGHLLVHLGRELAELDGDLNILRSIHLDGRVAWVVTSPSGDHLAVGTYAERYSLAYRNLLAQELPDEPEEDIRVSLYDGDFHPLMSVVRGSHLPAPVLSDSGELRVQAQGRERWRISEVDWQRGQRLLAVTRSSCRPTLSSPKHNLIFMLGCDATGGHWYRMLRGDGHPVLKGDSSSQELEQSARASAGGDFAVRTVFANKSFSTGQPFRPSDLTLERISVYSAATGAHMASLESRNFAPSEDSFALSPEGDQVAIIGRDSLSIYPFKTSLP